MTGRAELRRRAADAVATGFGAGRLPVAPGTWGSLVGVALALAVALAGAGPLTLAGVAVLLAAVGQASTAVYLERADREDPPEVVIDEIAGQFIATAVLFGVFATAWAVLASFALFRFFDILKPWPIGRLERVGGAAGVMLDDLAAGLAAAALGYAALGALYGY